MASRDERRDSTDSLESALTLFRNARLARMIALQVLHHLARQQFVVTKEYAYQLLQDDSFLESVVQEGTSMDLTLTEQTVLGEEAETTVREINRVHHTGDRTQGAGGRFDLVAADQGGEYCRLCGATEALAVDHIVPVAAGGRKTHLPNLQLLCGRCNSAKGAFKDLLLPYLMRTQTQDHVSEAHRYKYLELTSVVRSGRPLGVCGCGLTADEVRLRVSRISPRIAANILNLKAECDGCVEEEAPGHVG